MNKICVVAKNKETYFIKRLIEELGLEQVELFDPWSDFILPDADLYLARTTGVYHSDLDLMILQSLPEDKVLNPVKVLKQFRSKPVQYTWLEQNSFPCLPWLSLKDTDALTVEKFFRLYPKAVTKPLVGQGGWGVEAHDLESFKSWWKKKKSKNDLDYLIQPLVKEARELRYFFGSKMEAIVLERKALSGIAVNFQQQGQASLTSLSSEHQSVVESVAKASGAFYGAIDFFIKDGRVSILELNPVPGIEQLELVSGRNVIQDLLKTSP